MKRIFAALACAFAAAAFAGPIQLLKDINRTVGLEANPQVGHARPIAFGGGWILTLCTNAFGCEPWMTDGTAAGTRMIKDIRPGPFESSPTNYHVTASHAYFQAEGKLYRTDGTEVGTVALAEVAGVPFALSNSTLFFVGTDDQLWSLDSVSGHALKLTASASPRELTAIGTGSVLFREEMTGQLWISDGTVNGTTELRSLNPIGFTGGDPTGLTRVSGRVYFWAHDSDFSSPVLFITDGTPGGTHKVAEIESSANTKIVDYNTYAVFVAQGPHGVSGLWLSDGTEAGTRLLGTWPGIDSGEIVAAGGYVYFTAYHPSLGRELWRSDGTSAGTALLHDIRPGSSSPRNLVHAGSAVYFQAWASDGYHRVFKVQDGAPAIVALSDPGLPPPYAALGERVMLGTTLSSVWLSDGTDAGTLPVEVAEGQASAHARCGNGRAVMGGHIYFAANDGSHGCELWRSNGTAAGTNRVKDLAAGSAHGLPFDPIGHIQIAATDSLVFFMDIKGDLWRTDGTEAGTLLLADFFSEWAGELVTAGDKAYFRAWTPDAGLELWKSDGTPSGTSLVVDWKPGSVDSSPRRLVGFQGSVFFEAEYGNWTVLARSDGTSGGTIPLAGFPVGTTINNLVAAQSQLFFSVATSEFGEEVWRSDGTPAGTYRVVDLVPGPNSGVTPSHGGLPPLFTTMGNNLYFSGRSALPHYSGVYRSDGTAQGTVITHATTTTPYAAVLGSRFFYIAVNLVGTICNQETTPPIPYGISCLNLVSSPLLQPLVATPSTIFYLANTGAAGNEFWMTHGGPQELVEDFVPGPAGIVGSFGFNDELDATVLPTGVFFFAKSATAGHEPHFLAFDTAPDPITFPEVGNAARDVDLVSVPVKVTGINSVAPVSASNGMVCASSGANCACDVAPYSTSATVHFNQYLCVKHRTAATFGSSVTTTLSIGGVAASFTSSTPPSQPLTVVLGGSGAGTVSASQPGIQCPGDCTESYPQGSTVTLYASRLPGSVFAGWAGACTGLGACVLNLAAPASVTATFNISSMDAVRNDFNSDGRSDLLWRNGGGGYGVWVMNGIDSFGAGSVSAGPGAVIKQVGDFNGDGRADIVWRRADGSYQMDLMNGLSVVGTATILNAGTGWELVHKGDFNADGKTDLVWKGPTGTIGMWLMNGLTFTTAGAAAHPGAGFDVVQVADFSGDGKSDLLWRHTDGRINIALMDGLNSTGGTQLLGIANGWSPTHVGDLDDDGINDIAWRHTNGSIGLWLMNGLAIKQVATPMGANTGWSIAAMADLNGDGRMDLMWSRTDGTQAVWLMNGVVALDYGVFFGAGSGWSVAANGDYDGDGKDDIVWKHADGRHQLWLMHGMAVKASTQLVGAGSTWSVQP